MINQNQEFIQMKKPSYQVIYDDLKDKISRGVLAENDKLPVEPELAAEYGVSIGTLRRAVEKLEHENFLKREQGRGTFVCKLPGPSSSAEDSGQFNFGVLKPLSSQADVNKQIFGDNPFRQVILPSPLDVKPELSELWKRCSVVQLPLVYFALPEVQSYLAPLPADLGTDIPEPLLRECRTFDGELRLLPVISNPTFCYLWKPGFEAAGIGLPASDWSLNDFLDICRRLKSTGDIAPFGLMPFPGLFFELLLWHFGGDFHDAASRPWLPEAPFHSTMELTRLMLSENLCYNPYRKTVTVSELFNTPFFQMTFYGPHALGYLQRPQDWLVHPLPGKMNCQSAFGMAVPYNSPQPQKSLKLLRELTAGSRLQWLRNCSPAGVSARRHWCARQMVDNAVLLGKPETMGARILSGRHGFACWQNDVYTLLNDILLGVISVDDAYRKIKKVLEEKRLRYTEKCFFS